MKKLGINVGFKVGIWVGFSVDSGHFELFLNCQTIYYWYWLRDIFDVRRSRCRSGFVNCVWIWCNFGVVEIWYFDGVDFWWKV